MRARSFSSEPWPEADALFRSNPRWIGSDDASSIELSPGRILWLFGDTFVTHETGGSRRDAAFPRNSVGIQHGADPATATIEFAWGGSKDDPVSFFDTGDDTWYWPLHGARVAGGLLLFMMHVRSPVSGGSPLDDWADLGALGFFDVTGWAALFVENPDDDARAWRTRTLLIRDDMPVIGASVLVQDGYVYAYAWDNQKQITLARWDERDVVARIAEPKWWTPDGWSTTARAIVIADGATEFSIHHDAATGLYCQTQTMFTERGLGLRWAEEPWGPWSPLAVAFNPDEGARDDAFVYAAKAHPELSGSDLVLTYASNAAVEICLRDQSIYYPRFVRLSVEPS